MTPDLHTAAAPDRVIQARGLRKTYGGTVALSTAPEAARQLAARLTGARLTALMEQIEALQYAQLRNMNNTLLLTRLCATLRQAAGH